MHPEQIIHQHGQVSGYTLGHNTPRGKKPRTYAQGRRCRTCNKPLSRYNPTEHCAPCEIKRRPKP